MDIFIDTETTGKIEDYKAPPSEFDRFPRVVQIGFIVYLDGFMLFESEFIIRPDGFEIPKEASDIHGVSTEIAIAQGEDIKEVLTTLLFWIKNCERVIGHNVEFDIKVLAAEFYRFLGYSPFDSKATVCTMKASTNFCALPKANGWKGYKYPKLEELYIKLFGQDMGQAHTALQDITNTAKCYYALVERGIIT